MSSELKVTNIKALDGTAGISIADSTGVANFPNGLTTSMVSGITLFSSPAILSCDTMQSATSGSFELRKLNTIDFDPDSIITTLSSDIFTLASGKYYISWAASSYETGRHKSALFNETDSTAIAYGSSERAYVGSITPTNSIGSAFVNISSSKGFGIRHRVETSKATYGYGVSSGFGVQEKFLSVEIFKVL